MMSVQRAVSNRAQRRGHRGQTSPPHSRPNARAGKVGFAHTRKASLISPPAAEELGSSHARQAVVAHIRELAQKPHEPRAAFLHCAEPHGKF
jgi:hypothetical protein